MRLEPRAHGLVPRGILVHILQQVGHPAVGRHGAGVKVAFNDFPLDGEGREPFGHGGAEFLVAGHIVGALVDDGVILMLDGHRAQDVAALARHVHLGDGGAHPDGDGIRRHDPLFDGIRKDHMEVGPLFGQRFQGRAVPLAGVAAVDQLYLGVVAQVPVKPGKGLGHGNAVGAGKAGEIGTRHLGKLGYLVVIHAGVAEAGNIQVQFLVGVQAEFFAQGFLVQEIPLKFGAQKVHHHGAGHGGVFGLHAVGLQPLGGALAPAGLDALFGVAVHVEPVAFLLGVGKHLLPVEVDDLVAAADVIVHMAVDGFVIVHAAGHQHFRLVPAEQPQMLGVQQLADLHRVTPAFQL